MLKIFKYIILPIIFCSSALAAIDKPIVIMKWDCILCGRIYIGENPPKTQKCGKNPKYFDIWRILSIDTYYKWYEA